MTLPQAPEARPYYQSAKQRFLDAEFLLAAGRTTGAMYLAGYSVECLLKCLILERTPAGRRAKVVDSFRGGKAHDYDWLRKQYFKTGVPEFSQAVGRHFALVASLSTDLRYQSGTSSPKDAERFLRAVEEITLWAERSL